MLQSCLTSVSISLSLAAVTTNTNLLASFCSPAGAAPKNDLFDLNLKRVPVTASPGSFGFI